MKIPTTKEELLALVATWENAMYFFDNFEDGEQRKKAWDIICECEEAFDAADCWLDEDDNFCKEEAPPFLSGW